MSSADIADHLDRLISAEDALGGGEGLSRQVGEHYMRRVHGFAPPITLLEYCIERPGGVGKLASLARS